MAHKAYTFRYRVRNWRTYNQALIARGGISFDILRHRHSMCLCGEKRLWPQLASRSRVCVFGDEAHETRTAGSQL
jgi:hypothetical protein